MSLCLRSSSSSRYLKILLFHSHSLPKHQDMGGTPLPANIRGQTYHQMTNTILFFTYMYMVKRIQDLTFSLKSSPDRYGALKGFLECLPLSKSATLRQSNNLSNIDKSCCLLHLVLPCQTQSCGNSVAKHLKKKKKKKKRCKSYAHKHTLHATCTNSCPEMRQPAPEFDITCAARSTRIRENEVRWMCSYLSFGTRERPGWALCAPLSPRYRSSRCFQAIRLPLFYRE